MMPDGSTVEVEDSINGHALRVKRMALLPNQLIRTILANHGIYLSSYCADKSKSTWSVTNMYAFL